MIILERLQAVLRPRERDLVRFAQRLVQTPSFSGQEEIAARLVVQEMTALGYDAVTVDEAGNVAGVIRGTGTGTGTGTGKRLLFNTHLDHTVVNGRKDQWPYPPFAGAIADGKLYGLGACDIKGPMAAQVYAGALLRDSGLRLDGDLYVTAVVAEEGANYGIEHLMGGLPPITWAVVGEPSNLDVAIGHRGTFSLRVEVLGKTCHYSAPWRGTSALLVATDLLAETRRMEGELPSHPRLGRASMAAVNLTCEPGGGGNLPDVCRLTLNRRTVPGESVDGIVKDLEARFQRIVAGYTDASVTVAPIARTSTAYTGRSFHEPVVAFKEPWLLPEDHPLVRAGLAAVQSVAGRRGQTICWAFGTHAAHLVNRSGVPTIGLGPGREEDAHTPNDHVVLADLADAAVISARLAADLLGGA
jgi:putative selenium metabolism hydrolase